MPNFFVVKILKQEETRVFETFIHHIINNTYAKIKIFFGSHT